MNPTTWESLALPHHVARQDVPHLAHGEDAVVVPEQLQRIPAGGGGTGAEIDQQRLSILDATKFQRERRRSVQWLDIIPGLTDEGGKVTGAALSPQEAAGAARLVEPHDGIASIGPQRFLFKTAHQHLH